MRVEIKKLDPYSHDAISMVGDLDNYLQDRYPAESNHLDSADELSRPHVHFLGAVEGKELLGCGAVKLLPSGFGEIKRIYVVDEARGKGIGRMLLTALEKIAINAGYNLLRLETGTRQPEALAMFEQQGYRRISRFGDYPDDPLSVFMEKHCEELEQ